MNATAQKEWRSPEFLVVIAHNSGTFTDAVPAVTGNSMSVTDLKQRARHRSLEPPKTPSEMLIEPHPLGYGR